MVNEKQNAGQVVPDDPFGPIKNPASVAGVPTAEQVNRFHTKADTDAHAGAAHHTIGIKHDQAAAGDHIHDGTSSRKLLDGQVLTGSISGGTALPNLISLLSAKFGFIDSTTP